MRDDGPDVLPVAADDWDGGWDGEHLGEATAHAWLDGALPPDQAARAESHVAACADCAALVAEARGLIAGASRILGALDAAPAGVIPAPVTAPAVASIAPRVAPQPARPWWTRVPARAAAAALLLAGGSAVVLQNRGVPSASDQSSASVAPAEESVPIAASAPEPTPAPMAASGAATADAAPAAAPAARPQAAPPRAASRVAEQMAAPPMAPVPDRAAAKARPAGAPMPLAAPSSAASPVPAPAPPPPAPAADAARGASVGMVAGRVLTPDGRPLAAARVQLLGERAGAVTDDSGAFVLRDVRTGPATLQARRAGYQPQVASVVVTDADTASATVVLRQQTLGMSAATTTGTESRERSAREAPRLAAARRDVATALPSAAGCYLVTPLPGAAPALRPVWIALDGATVPGSAERPSYRGRVVPGGTATWTVFGGDSVRVTWPGASGDLVLRLAPEADGDLVGTLGAQPVTARRTSCAAMPAR